MSKDREDLNFLLEMKEQTGSLLNSKYDILKVQHLDKMISDWIDELKTKLQNTEQ